MKSTLGILTFMAIVLFGQLVISAQDTTDSKEARTKAAQRYLKVVSMAAMMEDAAEAMGKSLPPAKAAELKELMTKKLDLKALEEAGTECLIKHLSAKEINALADFYGTPDGRSIMKKFGAYMAELQPVIHREIQKAAKKK